MIYNIMKRKLLSDEDKLNIFNAYQSGESSEQVGKNFNIHPNTVFKILKIFNTKSRGVVRKKIKIEDDSIIFKLYEDGYSIDEISKLYDASNAIILRTINKANIVIRKRKEENYSRYSINDHIFDNINSEEQAYLLGFILSHEANLIDQNIIKFSTRL